MADSVQYALINENNFVLNAITVPNGQLAIWDFPDPRWRLVATDFQFDPIYDWANYRYDEDKKTFEVVMSEADLINRGLKA